MTLSFTQTIGGKTNYFIEKIWEGIMPMLGKSINVNTSKRYLTYQKQHLDTFGKYWDGTGEFWHEPVNPKLHTLRDDQHNRWRSGMDIHPVINNRTANRFQFAPVIK